MNNISFTGVKNIGTLNAISVNPVNHAAIEGKYMVINLTNDYNGKDLDEFKAAKKKCGQYLDGYIFPHDSNFIHISTKKIYNSDDVPRLFLNMREVPVKTETMPMFQYIAKLLNRISEMDNKDIRAAKDFVYGEGADLYILGDERISRMITNRDKYNESIVHAFIPPFVKAQAKSINDDIQAQMEDYFA